MFDKFTKKDSPETITLKEAIANLSSEMQGFEGHNDEYSKLVIQLEKLYKLLELSKNKTVSPDTLVIVAGNFIVALLVIGYEHGNVVTSKVWNFVLKLK
jgi:hypothetical protein